jgi:hypothetical protein
MVELIEVEPGKWRVKREELRQKRSHLPLPFVISDHMDPVEQVDGRFYTSKAAFRAVGRAHGLTEVGTEKFKPRDRSTNSAYEKNRRRDHIKTAIEKYKAGQRPNTANR